MASVVTMNIKTSCVLCACCMQMRCEFDSKSRNLGGFGTRRGKFTKSDQNAEFQVLCEKGIRVKKVREFLQAERQIVSQSFIAHELPNPNPYVRIPPITVLIRGGGTWITKADRLMGHMSNRGRVLQCTNQIGPSNQTPFVSPPSALPPFDQSLFDSDT